nr:hypothetical protein [uncultured Merdimonas sp.]
MKQTHTKAARIYGDIIGKSRPDDESSLIRHPRMPIPDRAKIFAPFAALTGYDKVIDQKAFESLLVPRPVLAEDELEKLSRLFEQIQKGQMVQVVFFSPEITENSGCVPTCPSSLGICRTQTGIVSSIDTDTQVLTVEDVAIPFGDILKLLPVS